MRVSYSKRIINSFFASGLILFFPLTVYSYKNEGMQLSYILGSIQIILGVLWIIHKNIKLRLNNRYLIFIMTIFLLSVISSMLIGFDSIYMLKFFSRLFFAYIYATIICSIIEMEDLIKTYKFFAWVSLVYLYIQVFSFYILHYYIKVNPLGLPLSQKNANVLIDSSNLLIFRPSSYFLEPGWYAVFILILLCIYLYEKKFVKSAIIFLSLIMATSSLGILTALGIVGVYFLSQEVKVHQKILILLGVCAGLFFFLTSTMFTDVILRLTDTGGSFGQRLLRGFYIIPQMGFPELITGIGFGNLEQYLKINDIRTPYDYGIPFDYVNSITQLYISGGIIGFISFFSWIGIYLFKGNLFLRMFNIMVILQMIGSSVFNGGIWLLYISFYCLMLNQNKINTKEVLK